MARWIESWMPGSGTGSMGRGGEGHPGQHFGLPAEGVSSVAGFGRRLAALVVDWLLGYLIAVLVLGSDEIGGPNLPWAVLGIWFLLTAIPVAVFGASAGMTLVGIRVASIDSAAVIGIPRALLRTALIALIVPPLVRDSDGRGWHDRTVRSIVVRTRA
jgi:uncharacterized RDD family membrane protein YckC